MAENVLISFAPDDVRTFLMGILSVVCVCVLVWLANLKINAPTVRRRPWQRREARRDERAAKSERVSVLGLIGKHIGRAIAWVAHSRHRALNRTEI